MSSLIAVGTGRIGREPETKQTDYGSVTDTRIAFDHGFGERKTTTWARVTAWGKLGELLCKLEKGNRVQVAGEIYTSTWTDKDNVDHTEVEIKASAITVIDWPDTDQKAQAKPPQRKRGGSDDLVKAQNKAAQAKPQRKRAQPAETFDDGLPF